jgi:hypothetical protein
MRSDYPRIRRPETGFMPELVYEPRDLCLKLRLIAEMLQGTAAAYTKKFTPGLYPVGRRLADKFLELSPHPGRLFRVHADNNGFTDTASINKNSFTAKAGKALPAGDYFVYFDCYYITCCHDEIPAFPFFQISCLIISYFAGFRLGKPGTVRRG